MDRAAREAAWAVDQHDPDNWLEIPDFGVQPGEVAFRGFAGPIVHPDSRPYEAALHLREMTRTARRIAREEFASMADVVQANLQAIDAYEAGEGLTPRMAYGLQYVIVMLAIRDAVLARGDWTHRFTELAAAGEWLAKLARLDADRLAANSQDEMQRLLERIGSAPG